jgi:3-oxoacyl-[acyl-carrier protein] reductase/meso-butanediol dehydrogenase/(S,S)-butanediol dehydrogenase/diacetyl reductase
MELRGFTDRVAIVTGAGRMRSIGRPIATLLAELGCDIALTGTGRPPERYPDDEKTAGWRDIDSVANEVAKAGRRALPLVSDVTDPAAVDALVCPMSHRSGHFLPFEGGFHPSFPPSKIEAGVRPRVR